MAKSRMEKNKKLYDALDEEMKNNKGNKYEQKLKSIDPNLDRDISNDNGNLSIEKTGKKSDVKNTSALTVIAKEINGKKEKKQELVKVKDEKIVKIDKVEEEDVFQDPISFTDKLSVEEILRAKLEQQEKIKNYKKSVKRSPCTEKYTPEMMQERIKLHEGVNVRKDTNVVVKDYKGLVLGVLLFALVAVLVLGILIIFKIIKI